VERRVGRCGRAGSRRSSWTGALLEKSFQGGEVLADRGLDARRRQALQREEIAQVELPAVVDPSPASDRPELDVAMKGRPVPRKRGHGERGGSLVDGDGEPLTIGKSDYDAFERLLGEIQSAYSAEDINALRSKVTPEMLSYFSEQLAENASRGVINKVDNVRLEQGDLAEAWREDAVEYASLAMRFSLTDRVIDRATGRTLEGGESGETTELWTFMRTRGGDWLLSAIQQT